MISFRTGLPVEAVLPELEQTLRTHCNAVLSAAPGAGKSTLVPPALLDSGFLGGKKILMLEPRRIAAVGAARRIAFLLGEKAGERAGYRTRFGSAVSAATRIEVITEGILTRMIQDDPELTGVGMIIFDEYHERSLHADLGLALALDVQNALRDDLRILVMSATLDTARIAALLGENTPVITSEGRVFPVETIYRPPEDRSRPLERQIVSSVLFALNRHPGDILVFLPGEGEIRRAIAELQQSFPDAEEQKLLFLPLYGNLPEKEQDRALAPAEAPYRKIILSTPVAESSVTVPGVRIVIDSGWMRVPRFSPATAMNRLETVRIPVASADQRRGRAGRTDAGLCIRLWSPAEERGFAPFGSPEILEADLAPLSLELAQWGMTPETAGSLRWLDPPPRAKLDQAFELLRSLDAVDRGLHITEHGKQLLRKPLHPRLAHLTAQADKLHHSALGCAIAAVLSERDFLRNTPDSDLNERLEFLLPDGEKNPRQADRGTLQRIKAAYRQLTSRDFSRTELQYTGILAAQAYPDRIAGQRGTNAGEYILSNGVVAKIRPEDDMRRHRLLCVPAAEGIGTVPTIYLAAEITLSELKQYLAGRIETGVVPQWNGGMLSVWQEQRIGSLVLERKQLSADSAAVDPELRTKTFLDGIRKQALPWSEHELSCLNRLGFLHRTLGDEWPDYSPEKLSATLEEWLAPFLTAKHTTLESLRGDTLAAAFRTLVGPDRLRQLDQLAPERLEVPSGSKIRIDYSHDPPLLPVRLQEVFGMTRTPMLAGGRVPLVMDLLSPAMRTVQITSDLAGFWADSYFLVRKEMRGRYPKHDWPENPLEAPPHRGSLKRKTEK
jgi:ATP-dependent helicase HrpB